jgi:tRNA-specific 2-thiouridylase
MNWIAFDELRAPIRVHAKIRHRHEPAPAMVENAGNGEVRVTFDEPQRAITPGQAVVFYDGDIVVGGGWIASFLPPEPVNAGEGSLSAEGSCR